MHIFHEKMFLAKSFLPV